MPDNIKRMREEKAELSLKIEELRGSIWDLSDEDYEAITRVERDLLSCQLNVMRQYSEILTARLNRAYKTL